MYNKIIARAKKKGSSQEDAEDIAQEVIISWLEYEKKNGQKSHQLIEHAIIDAKRKLFGSSRVSSYKLRKSGRFGIQAPDDQEQILIESIADTSENDDGGTEEFRKLIDRFGGIISLKEFVSLKMVADGESLLAVGDVFGFTESRASQMMSALNKKLERYEIFRRRKEFIEEHRTELFVDWLSL